MPEFMLVEGSNDMSSMSDQLRILWKECGLSSRSPRTSEFVEQLVALAHDYGPIWVEVKGDRLIVFSNPDGDREQFGIGYAKSLVRNLCARLTGWAAHNGAANVHPYGDHCEVMKTASGGTERRVQIDFMNTTKAQWFRIQSVEFPPAMPPGCPE